jgi:NADH dehydrogenase [ubiquinone] 1 alpha subcomplex assembly factor 1
MKIMYLFFLLIPSMQAQTIYDFNPNSDASEWSIVDDVVMGGRSNGNFEINGDGHGEFSGYVTTENNGGFSSIRCQFEKISTTQDNKISLILKGDGKEYQLRLKDNVRSYYSYITTFKTSGEWQKITIPVKDLYPSFRGRTLDLPNYNSSSFEEISILIGNKKKETFRLILDKIELE